MSIVKNNLITMNEVAEHAGVSQSTVSRVINNYPRINSHTRDTVMRSMHKLGYVVAPPVHKTISSNKKRTIAVVMCAFAEHDTNLGVDYFSKVVSGASSIIYDKNVEMILVNLEHGATTIEEDNVKLGDLDGVIIAGDPTDKLIETLKEHEIQYIILTEEGQEVSSDCDTVEYDTISAYREVCRLFLEHDITRFGIIMSKHYEDWANVMQIEMVNSGYPIDEKDIYILDNMETSTFIMAIHDYINKGNLPKAIVVCFYEAAIAVRSILECNDIRVPEDIIIFTHNKNGKKGDLPMMYCNPSILGQKAALRLVEKLAITQDESHRIVIPLKFSIKQFT